MVKIVPTHPHLVAVHQNGILAGLDDQDLSIRMRALDLVSSMVGQLIYIISILPDTHDENPNAPLAGHLR